MNYQLVMVIFILSLIGCGDASWKREKIMQIRQSVKSLPRLKHMDQFWLNEKLFCQNSLINCIDDQESLDKLRELEIDNNQLKLLLMDLNEYGFSEVFQDSGYVAVITGGSWTRKYGYLVFDESHDRTKRLDLHGRYHANIGKQIGEGIYLFSTD